MSEEVIVTKKEKRKGLISNIITGILFGLVAIMIGLQVYGQVTAKNGVVKYGTFATFVVASDSMEPTYKVGTMVFVVETKAENLKVNDTITFIRNHGTNYNPNDSGADGRVITHRIKLIETIDGELHFRTLGDNLNAKTCNGTCSDSNRDWVKTEDIIGKVTGQNVVFGKVNTMLKEPVYMLLFVLVPLAAVFGSSLVDLFKQIKSVEKEQGTSTDNDDTNYEFEALKEQEKLKMMIELEKEKMREELLREDKKDEKHD